MSDPVRGYLALGLRFGRLVDGYVDCWIGDPALAAEVAAEPVPPPGDLARQATELRAALADSALTADRRAFLDAQLRALACAAGKLAGEPMSFLAEVEEYFDVRITLGDPDHYLALHDELAQVLPGHGPLRERLVAFRAGLRLPAEELGRAARAVVDALRARLGGVLDLPAEEHIDCELVEDRPWNAFNEYLGGYRSRITLNVDAGHWMSGLAIVATHEAYPGHHADHCLKERLLLREAGQLEQAITLVNTPQCLLAEGTAEMGLAAALGDGWGEWTAQVLAAEGLHLDGARAERVDRLMWELTAARQDAAILMHDRGAPEDDVAEFLGRWMLVDTASARQAMRFLADPLWRAYVTTYIEGRRLVREWLAARPAGQSIMDRYRILLTDQLLPADLRTAVGLSTPGQGG